MYDLVFQCLTATGLMEDYVAKFKENKMDDLTVAKCLTDPSLLSHFNEVMPVVGDRIKFIAAFQNVQIPEPSSKRLKNEKNVAIGIDLGTTNCRVGVYHDGRVQVIKDDEGQSATPCHVAFFENDRKKIVVGEKAMREALSRPTHVIFDTKRLLGRKFSDPALQKNLPMWPFTVVNGAHLGSGRDDYDEPKLKVGDDLYHPEEISARIILKMKKMAENHLQREVTDAVITVPAFFTNGQRQATKDAGTIAGLNVLKILNEPSAAVIAHQFGRQGIEKMVKKNLLVFDLGGGTLDVAIIEIDGPNLTTLAVHGDSRLGGQDFDGEMARNCIDIYHRNYGGNPLGPRGPSMPVSSATLTSGTWSGQTFNVNMIQQQCQQQNQALSNLPRGQTVNVEIGGHQVPFTRDTFNALNQSRFDQCLSIVAATVAQAGLTKYEIDDVVLVGGSTKIPRVREMLTNYFEGRLTLNNAQDGSNGVSFPIKLEPDDAVVFGATVQAALLTGQEVHGFDMNAKPVRDVTPMSIGARVRDGSLSVIVPKNTPIPCSLTKQYFKTTFDQTDVQIQVFEGENHRVADWNHLLGHFILTGIPRGPPNHEPLDATMTISDEGILNVRAVVRSNGATNQISVHTQKKRMTQDQIEAARRRLVNLTIF